MRRLAGFNTERSDSGMNNYGAAMLGSDKHKIASEIEVIGTGGM